MMFVFDVFVVLMIFTIETILSAAIWGEVDFIGILIIAFGLVILYRLNND
jgi:hypothetical protein